LSENIDDGVGKRVRAPEEFNIFVGARSVALPGNVKARITGRNTGSTAPGSFIPGRRIEPDWTFR